MADPQINPLTRTVRRSGERIDLQPRDVQLLDYLMRHAGRVAHINPQKPSEAGATWRPAAQRDPIA